MARPAPDPLGEHFATIVLELAPDGIAVTDEAGRILHANGRFEELFGYSRDDLVGHPIEMLLPERVRTAHRAHRHDFEQQPTTRPMGRGLDLRARHADGREFAVEIGLSPVVTGNGLRTIMAVRPVRPRSADRASLDRAVLADEHRIAGALNDQVVRPIFAASLGLQTVIATSDARQAARLRGVIDELDQAIRAIRAIVYDAVAVGADPVATDASPAHGSEVDRVGRSLAGRPAGPASPASPASPAGPAGPGSPASPATVIEYAIDANDRLEVAEGGWADFAVANGAPELAQPDRTRTLWHHIADDEVRDLWQRLVRRVRNTGRPLAVPLRCDSPATRRWLEMTVSPGPDRSVRFRSVVVFEEPRPAIAALDRTAERDPDLPPIPWCSWCGRSHDGTAWVDIEQIARARRLLDGDPVPAIEQGICPTCAELMSAELDPAGGPGRAG